MKKGMVVGLSIMALIGFCIVLFYQVTHIDKPVVRKSMVSKRTNIIDFVTETISDEETPLSAEIEDEEPEDGISVKNKNKIPQKEIESSEITSFYCNFSTLYEEDTHTMGNKQWKLRADFDGKTVKGSYKAFNSDSNDERRFDADKSFMKELFEIIRQYDLASYNGLDNETKGIPDEYGATLSVMFESGENIYASDNAENFLPIDAEDAFVQLFASACAKGSDVIGVSVTGHYEDVEVSGGRGHISFPLVHLGRTDAFGKVDELKYPTEDELHEAIDNINSFEMDEALAAKDSYEKGSKDKELFYDSDLFVTRNDTEVISLYVRENSRRDVNSSSILSFYRTYNVDSRTGNELEFSDVFRDIQGLPGLIEERLRKKYPGHKFDKDIEEHIRKSIMENDGDVCFALGNGFAHIFINEGVADNEPGSYHVTLPFEDNTKLISNFYTAYPEKTFTRLDYDTDYFLKGGLDFRMEYEIDEEEDITWRGISGRQTEELSLYGYAPEVYLTTMKDKNYLFLNVPTGDVSFYGIVYEITENGIEIPEDNGDLGLSVIPETTLDPDYVLMYVNEVIDGTVCFMYPTGVFKIDDDGFPVPASKEFRLTGGKVAIRESGRYNPRNSADASHSGGMFYVAEGTEVTPYASDLSNYIDFITVGEDESRIIRFTIDKFSSDMKLDNFGGLDKVFK